MIEPINNTLLVKPKQRRPIRTKGGIEVPPTQQIEMVYGEVMSSGPGAYNDGGHFVENRLKPGTHIIFNRIYSTDVVVGGNVWLFVEECNVFGTISKDELLEVAGLERLQ
jgi:co-chaperonin GroES (HSP10)